MSFGLHAAAFAFPAFQRYVAVPDETQQPVKLVEITELHTLPIEPARLPPILRPAEPVVYDVADLYMPDIVAGTLDSWAAAPMEIAPPPVAQQDEFADYLAFMPSMVMPELKNRVRVRRELERRFPNRFGGSGTQARVDVMLWIDEQGVVRKHEIVRTSGSAGFDRVVEEVIPLMELTPPLQRGRAVRAIVHIPIEFRAH